MPVKFLAEVYRGLAEALAWPPANWLATSGRDWPLYETVVSLASHNRDAGWQQAVIKMTEITPAGISIRYQKYRDIFHPCLGAAIGLYECQHVNGRFPGPATFAVKNLYEQVGMAVEGAEMPDHASVELAFLSYLCQQETKGGAECTEWRRSRWLFIRNHAGKWLPGVGRALLNSGDVAWETLGQVLIASVDLSKKPQEIRGISNLVPMISDISHCNLCGFCVQVCPTHALIIREDEQQTELCMMPEKCVGCHKCEQVCNTRALSLAATHQMEPVVLMCSERAHCPQCGTPTVSQAELKAVAAKLGEYPPWLDTCLSCR